jgi:polyisoprenoid-binding protein YceI
MNRDLWEAMKAVDYPEIRFSGDEAVIDKNEDGSFRFEVRGRVFIAGVEREIGFDAGVSPQSDDRLHVSGKIKLNMKDYGIDPPRAFLGALRTGEEIMVEFGLVLEK